MRCTDGLDEAWGRLLGACTSAWWTGSCEGRRQGGTLVWLFSVSNYQTIIWKKWAQPQWDPEQPPCTCVGRYWTLSCFQTPRSFIICLKTQLVCLAPPRSRCGAHLQLSRRRPNCLHLSRCRHHHLCLNVRVVVNASARVTPWSRCLWAIRIKSLLFRWANVTGLLCAVTECSVLGQGGATLNSESCSS